MSRAHHQFKPPFDLNDVRIAARKLLGVKLLLPAVEIELRLAVAGYHDRLRSLASAGMAGGRQQHIALWRVWYSISPDTWRSSPPADCNELEHIRAIFQPRLRSDEQSLMSEAVTRLTDVFDLPALKRCNSGLQSERVEALDVLAKQLLAGPKAPVTEALIGFAASLIEPGVAVLPDLLRRYSELVPLAPVWCGAFAGLWSPVRVLSDFNGLGRILHKSIHAPSDLFRKPDADISFEELQRWLGPNGAGQVHVRGLVPRTLNVELYPSVSAVISSARLEAGRSNSRPSSERQRNFDLDNVTEGRGATGYRPSSTTVRSEDLVQQLMRRLSALEEVVESALAAPKRPSARGSVRKTKS